MISKTIITLVIFLSFAKVSICQHEPQPETKTYILNILQNGDYYERSAIIGDVTYLYRIPEAVPILEQTIWNQDRNLAFDYLIALEKYNSSNFNTLAHRFLDVIDTLYVLITDGFDFSILEMKAYITDDLMDRNDYTTIQFVFDLVDSVKPKTFIGEANMLSKIVEHVPEKESRAKLELFNIAQSNDDNNSYDALNFMLKKYRPEMISILPTIYINNTYRPVKSIVLDALVEFRYSDLENLLRSRLLIDSSMTSEIAEDLLEYYPTPFNYNFITDRIDQISNDRKLRVNFLLQGFTPKVDSSISNIEMIDKLNYLTDTLCLYNWLGDLTFSNELKNILTTAKTNLQAGDSLACRVQVKAFQDLVDNVYKDSLNTDVRFVTIEGWKFLYWNAQYILDRLPEPPANPNLLVNLKNSLGTQIPASNVTYYENSWKDAVNNGDGTFTVITTRATVSIRVFYEYASQQVDNVPAQNNTYTFTTVNAAVQLKNSLGNLIDQGTVQYYAGAWRSFGTTSNGIAYKELLPINYSFRMTYEYVSKDKQQNLSTNPVVDFSTVLCSVKVSKTSNNQPINNAAVKYYAGAWRNLGTTNSNGIATRELIPANISFRATLGSVSLDKQQDISVNSLVEILLNVP